MLVTSSAFEAVEIQVDLKHILSKANLQKRVDRLNEQFAEEKLCAALQEILALAVK